MNRQQKRKIMKEGKQVIQISQIESEKLDHAISRRNQTQMALESTRNNEQTILELIYDRHGIDKSCILNTQKNGNTLILQMLPEKPLVEDTEQDNRKSSMSDDKKSS